MREKTVAGLRGMGVSSAGFSVSVLAAVAVWCEVTYRGFLPLPVVLLPLLSLVGLGLSVLAMTRTAAVSSKALAALGAVLSLGAFAVVLLLLGVVVLYMGS